MWAAQGQVAYDWRYWFDQSPTYEQGSSEGSLHLDVDVSGLSKSLHQIHVQVRDTAGMFSEPVSRYFVVPDDGHDSSKLHYWFDQNSAALHVADLVDGMFDLDVSELPSGFHTLHFIVTDKAGVNSEPAHKGFMRATDNASLKWRYWFDDARDKSVVMPPTTTSLMIDVDSLTDGLHYIHFQAMNENFSEAKTQMFVKVPKTMDLDEMFCLVMIDNSLYSKETINMKNGGMATLDLDVKDLSQGFHKLDVMVMTPSGALSAAYSSYFVRGYLSDDRGALRCLYAFDDETDVHETIYSEGMSHLNLDVAHLEDGPHSVHWMLADKEGAYVSDKRSWFIKLPLGGNAVSKYCYWLNDADSVKHVKVLEEPKNPYDLIALLPVETMPLRSSCFHFENKDNQPMMYAKNDIHFTFTDKFDRETNISKQFVDYNTTAAVTDVTELKSTQTFARLDDNNIKWFKFEAEEGDTLTFKTDQACSIQLFSPTGKELYSAMGEKSVIREGCHTWENGIHYLAVHNTTGSKENVTLDFSHIAKYEIVSQDVKVVGNGGCSTITIKGNGFKDLYDVELIVNTDDGTNVLHALDINHISDAEVGLTFDFSHVKLKYHPGVIGSGTADHPLDTPDYSYWESTNVDAVFHFTEKDKTMSNFLRVDEEKPIELATNVTFPSSYGHVVTYTCKITNKGNMTAYAVPIYIWMKSKQEQGIFDVRIEGLDLPRLSDYVSSEVLTQSEVTQMKTALDALDDDHYFMKYWVEDEDSPADSVCVRSNYFYTNIAPGETKTVRLTISTREVDAFAYFTLPEEWPSYSIESESPKFMAKARFASAKSESWYCCYRDRIECVANIICNGLDIASLFSVPGPTAVNIASCVAGGMNQVLTAAGDTYCGKNDVEGDFVKKVNNVVKGINITAALTSCASAFGVKNASEIVAVLDAVTHPSVSINCITAFFSKKPNCPPTPPGGGGTHGGKSHDPNEIYGYLSQAGSKFLADSVRNVNYRIEFENDTTFATASAHVVEVKDTLDSKYFDLTTFAPTSVKIGDKVEYLDGTPNFVKTVDMRPAINAIAQVEGKYDEKKGIATWTFTSLDPMTMEPTDDVMQGFLPVNYDGESGIGEVTFDVSLKGGFADGTEIPNKASIVFDINEPILTPTWTNTIDAVAPTGHVVAAKQKDYETATLTVEGTDERSGVWAYDVYVQYGTKAEWLKVAEKVSPREDGTLDVKVYEGINHGFYVCAVDSAGNVEVKEPLCEVRLDLTDMISGDANGDGSVSVGDMTTVISALKGESPEEYDENGADANHDGIISVEDLQAIIRRILRK